MLSPAQCERNWIWPRRETAGLGTASSDHGCVLAREGGNHSIWKNSANGKVAAIPRHREIKEGTVRAACRQLEIPKP